MFPWSFVEALPICGFELKAPAEAMRRRMATERNMVQSKVKPFYGASFSLYSQGDTNACDVKSESIMSMSGLRHNLVYDAIVSFVLRTSKISDNACVTRGEL